MPRNFRRRIETVFPIEDAGIQARIVGDVLQAVLADNVKARELLPDGSYRRRARAAADPLIRSQLVLQHLAREAARGRRASPSLRPDRATPARQRRARRAGAPGGASPRFRLTGAAHAPRRRPT